MLGLDPLASPPHAAQGSLLPWKASEDMQPEGSTHGRNLVLRPTVVPSPDFSF